jgi:dipeptidyl aminopeptidase/acylaminoacyl peptidase
MQKKVWFLNSAGQKLAGILHIPGKGRYPAIAMLHGRSSDKETHEKEYFAEQLSKKGFAVLRFDMPGCGESQGRKEEMTISGEVDSAKAAIDFLCRRSSVDANRIGVTGSSQGGFDSLILASSDKRIKALVTVSAVINFREVFALSGTDMKKWKKGGYCLLGKRAMKINYTYAEDILKNWNNMKDIVPKIKCPTLVIHGDADSVVPVSQGHRIYELLKCEKSLHIIKGAGHQLDEEETEQRLRETIEWFSRRLGGQA